MASGEVLTAIFTELGPLGITLADDEHGNIVLVSILPGSQVSGLPPCFFGLVARVRGSTRQSSDWARLSGGVQAARVPALVASLQDTPGTAPPLWVLGRVGGSRVRGKPTDVAMGCIATKTARPLSLHFSRRAASTASPEKRIAAPGPARWPTAACCGGRGGLPITYRSRPVRLLPAPTVVGSVWSGSVCLGRKWGMPAACAVQLAVEVES